MERDILEYMNILDLGKVSQEVLERSVFPFLPLERKPELDAGVIQCQGPTIVSHSPSIGLPLEALGFFSFHYAASNVAARFAKPENMVVGIYLPLETRERDLRVIAKSIGQEAINYGVSIVAGQTATYAGLEIPLLTSTCFGKQLKYPMDPVQGDMVYIVGSIGGEAIWLKSITEGKKSEIWKKFTPLTSMLHLHEYKGVKIMHDISEGGVKKALHEISTAFNIGIEIDSDCFIFVDGVDELGEDPLRLPTYGSFISLVDPANEDEVHLACKEIDVNCAAVGVIKKGEGLYIDGARVKNFKRIDFDKLYGSFKKI